MASVLAGCFGSASAAKLDVLIEKKKSAAFERVENNNSREGEECFLFVLTIALSLHEGGIG